MVNGFRVLRGSLALAVLAGATLFLWTLVASMTPAADASAPTVVDLSTIAPGERRTLRLPRHPVFIVHRTPEQIASVRADDDAPMPSPQPDAERVQRAEWLVVDSRPPAGYWTFTQLVGQQKDEPAGRYGGWFDNYSTAHYDLSGRVREGWKVTENLVIPDYYFLNDTTLVID